MFNIEYGKSYCKRQVGSLTFSLKNTTQHRGCLLVAIVEKVHTWWGGNANYAMFSFLCRQRTLGQPSVAFLLWTTRGQYPLKHFFQGQFRVPQIHSMYSRRMEATYLLSGKLFGDHRPGWEGGGDATWLDLISRLTNYSLMNFLH